MVRNRKLKDKNLKGKKETKKRKQETKGEKREIKIILENERPLEERIEKLNESEFENFLEQLEIPKVSPSLRKINAPQKIPARLEENLIQSSSFNEEEEENSIKYNLIGGEKKKEAEYSIISQEYSAIQKETLKHNPHIITKEQSFVDLNRKNIVENFPKRNFNPFAEETLTNSVNTDKNYISKLSFTEKERKPHNPFERKEAKYENFEQ
ncbi:MAG: hypothetical protein ABIE36_00620 [Candidatus Diapherotrites archaeon]